MPLLYGILIVLAVLLLLLLIAAWIFWVSPQTLFRIGFWCLTFFFYRIRVFGGQNIPATGGVLLISNHVSWLDGFLLLFASPRPIRPVAWAGNFENGFLRWLALHCGMILLGTRPKELLKSLKEAQQGLKNGDVIAIFPEGGITRTGQVQGFRPGLTRMLEDTGAKVVPVYLDQVWGSIFSYAGGTFFWKWPKRIPYPISIHVGEPLPDTAEVFEIRQAILHLGSEAMQNRPTATTLLPEAFIRQCQRRLFVSKAADTLGGDVTGGELLTRTLILRALLNRGTLGADEKYVGVLLPPSVPAVIVNTAVTLDRRIAVNLNYTVSEEVINDCIRQCGIKHILTSHKFLEKMEFKNLEAELVCLEDFKDSATWMDKAIGAMQAYTLPASLLSWYLGLGSIQPDDTMTIIFTSGSTGSPKGVMLTYANVAHNTEAIDQVIQLTPNDVILGILPFFHSFGYTVTLWTVLGLDVKGGYHINPLQPGQVGRLCEQQKGTILLSTPTFLRGYLRKVTDEFKTLDVVVAGAEKLPKEVADSFEEKFKCRPVEGYGTTELSPLVSVNIPPSRSTGNFQVDRKEGSVGRPVPGVTVKCVDLETGADLGPGESGMILVKGPNVMKGYLNRPEETAKVLKEGWYTTGDVGFVDEDGFIFITGRESRFSKIGGEMVPHIRIEEEIGKILAGGDSDEMKAAVTAVPDAKKGERIVVIHTKVAKTPQEICEGLSATGLPNLYIPGSDSFVEVETLPILGTGKLDLRALKKLATDRFAPSPTT